MPQDGPVIFGKTAANRTRAAVIRVERMPYPRYDRQSVWPVISGGVMQYSEGIVTNTITAFNANTNTYGSGTVQAYQPVFNTNTNTYVSQADNSIGNVQCLNFAINTNSIATNTRVGMMTRTTANSTTVWELIWAC